MKSLKLILALMLAAAAPVLAAGGAKTMPSAGKASTIGESIQVPDTTANKSALDSAALVRLDSMLVYYTGMIGRESTETKEQECDFLIGSVADPGTACHIATWLFDYYKESKLMGDEAVAIHVWDTCFKSKRFKYGSEFADMDAEIFVEFNRHTLLGMKAPEVALKNPQGRLVRIPEEGCISILWFYDTSCAKCRVESKVLPGVLGTCQVPATLYAVYCGSDRKSWRKFRHSFKVPGRNVRVMHLWDPEMDTDYLRLYGVISTPRLYVTTEDNEIIGRRLEPESLQEILNIIADVKKATEKEQ